MEGIERGLYSAVGLQGLMIMMNCLFILTENETYNIQRSLGKALTLHFHLCSCQCCLEEVESDRSSSKKYLESYFDHGGDMD